MCECVYVCAHILREYVVKVGKPLVNQHRTAFRGNYFKWHSHAASLASHVHHIQQTDKNIKQFIYIIGRVLFEQLSLASHQGST